MAKFDPNRPYEVVEMGGKPPKEFDPNKPYEVAGPPPENTEGVFNTVVNTLDIPGAAARSALRGQFGQHVQNIRNEGLIDASAMAPSEQDLAQDVGLIDEESSSLAKFGASVGVGMVTDPTSYLSLGTAPMVKSLVKKAAKNSMVNQTAKALAKIKPLTKGEAIDRKIDTGVMATTLANEDYVKYIKKPSRLLEVLGGRRPITETPTSAGTLVKRSKEAGDKGKISEISDDLGETIQKISTRKRGVPSKEITDPVSAKLMELAEDKVSGVRYSPEELASMENYIYKLVDSDKPYTLEEVYQLKKNIGKQLSSPLFFQPADKAISASKEVMLGVQRRLDEVLEANLKKANIDLDGKMINAGDYYKVQNDRMHRLINIRDVLQMVPEKELRDSDLAATILGLGTQAGIGGALGLGIGMTTGIPNGAISGAMITGGFAAARGAGRAMTENFPSNAARGLDILPEVAPYAAPAISGAARMMSGDSQEPYARPTRSPQSINLPLQLVKTKLPRDVEGILANKKVLLAKVAQQAPQAFEHVKFVVEERPEDIEQMLPMIMQLVPHAFESDKYGRINGKILDPLMQQKARKDIRDDARLSNTQKANMLDRLNRSNELEGY